MATTADHMADMAHEAGDRADEALRRKASQLQKFFDDVEELLRRVSDMGDTDIARLRSRVESTIGHAKDVVRDSAQVAIDRTKAAAQATDGYVHRNPWTAIGASAAVGLLLGALLSRK